MNQDRFIEELRKINIEITEFQLNQLEKYYEMLIEWNKFMNLTGITKKEDVYLKHFYDSLTTVKVIDLNKINNLCDVGTGAGFPGIVLKIIFPHIKIVLVDSLQKRINFLNEIILKLNLKNIETIHSRIEDYDKNNREKFDIVISRAVAPLNILLEYCIPIVKEHGYFIAMKGNITEEIKKSYNALTKLNSEIIIKETFSLPIENSNRTILLIKKMKKTNKKYPRKNKEIKENSL